MYITLVPYAGLCNRLNAIGSALAYKEKFPETELSILWHKRRHCNCRFKDLFQQLPEPFSPVKELCWQWKDYPGTRFNLNLPQIMRGLFYDCSILPSTPADDFDVLTQGKNRVYVSHDNRFCKEYKAESLAEIFRPIEELQRRIDNVVENWNNNVIGLHIRRTDNKHSISLSPITHFYEVIEKELQNNNKVRFYVATDDVEVKNDLLKRYGDRIITIPLCLKRNSVQGMKDAVVDLFCLGHTKKIYGSFHSTYSSFAARLFNIDVII